jgi:hypothetical protein
MGDAVSSVASGDLADGFREARLVRFFYLVPTLGLLVLAPFVMLVGWSLGRRDPPEWELAVSALIVAGLGCLTWGLVLFGPPNAVTFVHQGSLAVPILALCGAVAGLRATFRRLANALIGVNALIVLILYAPALDHPANSSYSVVVAVLALISVASFGLVALRGETFASTSARPVLQPTS